MNKDFSTDAREKIALKIAASWKVNRDDGDPGEALQKAVEKVMGELPTKKRELSGWMDLNCEFLEGSRALSKKGMRQ
jgi:hypothetical protein